MLYNREIEYRQTCSQLFTYNMEDSAKCVGDSKGAPSVKIIVPYILVPGVTGIKDPVVIFFLKYSNIQNLLDSGENRLHFRVPR